MSSVQSQEGKVNVHYVQFNESPASRCGLSCLCVYLQSFHAFLYFFFCRRISVDRLQFYPDGALGYPYGTYFEVHGKQLVPRESVGTSGRLIN